MLECWQALLCHAVQVWSHTQGRYSRAWEPWRLQTPYTSWTVIFSAGGVLPSPQIPSPTPACIFPFPPHLLLSLPHLAVSFVDPIRAPSTSQHHNHNRIQQHYHHFVLGIFSTCFGAGRLLLRMLCHPWLAVGKPFRLLERRSCSEPCLRGKYRVVAWYALSERHMWML